MGEARLRLAVLVTLAAGLTTSLGGCSVEEGPRESPRAASPQTAGESAPPPPPPGGTFDEDRPSPSVSTFTPSPPIPTSSVAAACHLRQKRAVWRVDLHLETALTRVFSSPTGRSVFTAVRFEEQLRETLRRVSDGCAVPPTELSDFVSAVHPLARSGFETGELTTLEGAFEQWGVRVGDTDQTRGRVAAVEACVSLRKSLLASLVRRSRPARFGRVVELLLVLENRTSRLQFLTVNGHVYATGLVKARYYPRVKGFRGRILPYGGGSSDYTSVAAHSRRTVWLPGAIPLRPGGRLHHVRIMPKAYHVGWFCALPLRTTG